MRQIFLLFIVIAPIVLWVAFGMEYAFVFFVGFGISILLDKISNNKRKIK